MTTSLSRAVPPVVTLLALMTACGSGPSRGGTGGDQMVLAEDVERNPGKPIEQILQDKVSGVVVRRNGEGEITVQIRGGGSLSGNDAPLYILDNLPYQPGPGGALSGVDPYSIETIRVLKSAVGKALFFHARYVSPKWRLKRVASIGNHIFYR